MGAETRRILREQIKRATRAVLNAEASLAARVHLARTSCKKARAALQLVRNGCPGRWKRENAWFRDSARLLAPLRDATVLLSTFTTLRRRFDRSLEGRTYDALRRQLLAHSRESRPGAAEVKTLLTRFAQRMRTAAGRVAGSRLGISNSDVAEGFGETYRRARRAWRTLEQDSSTRAFHEWRKHTKAHAYHHRLLRCAWPAIMCEWQHELEAVGHLLGEEHDLAVLDAVWRKDSSDGPQHKSVVVLLGLIQARREELRAQAVAFGARLFAEKPSAVKQRISGWWSAAR